MRSNSLLLENDFMGIALRARHPNKHPNENLKLIL